MRDAFVAIYKALAPLHSSPFGPRLLALLTGLLSAGFAGVASLFFGHFGGIFLVTFVLLFVGDFVLNAWGLAGDQWGYSSDGFVDEQPGVDEASER